MSSEEFAKLMGESLKALKKAENENFTLKIKALELSNALAKTDIILSDILSLIQEHGNSTIRSHATRLSRAYITSMQNKVLIEKDTP